jgi:hypothetical protein
MADGGWREEIGNNGGKKSPIEIDSSIIWRESHFWCFLVARPPSQSSLASVIAHCIALHCIALHCIALHCIALHCIAFYILLHSFQSITKQYGPPTHRRTPDVQ